MASCASCRVRVVRRGPWARDRAEEGGRADAGRTGWMGCAPCAWRSVRVDSSGWGLGSCCACLALPHSCLAGRWGWAWAPPGQGHGAGPRDRVRERSRERRAALNFTNTMAIHNGRQRSDDRTAKSVVAPQLPVARRQSRHDVSRQFDSTQTRPALPGTYVRTRTRMPGGQLLSSATLTTRSPCCPNLFVPVEQHQRAPRTLPSTLHRSTTHVLPASQTSQPFTAKPVSVRRTSLQIDPHAGACSPARRH